MMNFHRLPSSVHTIPTKPYGIEWHQTSTHGFTESDKSFRSAVTIHTSSEEKIEWNVIVYQASNPFVVKTLV